MPILPSQASPDAQALDSRSRRHFQESAGCTGTVFAPTGRVLGIATYKTAVGIDITLIIDSIDIGIGKDIAAHSAGKAVVYYLRFGIYIP